MAEKKRCSPAARCSAHALSVAWHSWINPHGPVIDTAQQIADPGIAPPGKIAGDLLAAYTGVAEEHQRLITRQRREPAVGLAERQELTALDMRQGILLWL